MEKGDIDVVVIGYITQDTIALIDEDGNRADYNACGGVASYFSMVTSALKYKTGIVTPVGDDFFQDYIDDEIVDRFNLSDDDVLRIKDYVDTHPASAERLKSGLKEYLENEIGLDKQRADALSEDIAYKAIFNPLHAAKYIDNTGYRYIKGENTSKITVLVPSSGYTVGIVDHRLPKIEAADIPDKYLRAKAIHIGALFGEVTLDAVRYIRAHTDAKISLDSQGYIRRLKSFSDLLDEDIEALKNSGAKSGEIEKWMHDNAEVVYLHKWDRMKDYGRYVDMMKMNEYEAIINAGVETDIPVDEMPFEDKYKVVEKTMAILEDELVPVNEDIILIITMGGDGSLISYKDMETGKRKHIYQAALSSRVVDTTGAGDTYAAAFLTEYVETGDIEWSALFASAAASLQVESEGPYGFPGRDAVVERAKGEGVILQNSGSTENAMF